MTSNTEKQLDQNFDQTQVAHDQEYGLFAQEHNHVHGEGCSCGHDHDHHDHHHDHNNDEQDEADFAESRKQRYELVAQDCEIRANSPEVSPEERTRLLKCAEIFRSPNPEDVYFIESAEFLGLPSEELYPNINYKLHSLKSLSSQERRILSVILATQEENEKRQGYTAEERRSKLPENYQQIITEKFSPEQAEALSYFPELILKGLFERPNFEEFYEKTLKSTPVFNLQNYLYQTTGYMYPNANWPAYKGLTQFHMEKVLKYFLRLYTTYVAYIRHYELDVTEEPKRLFLIDRLEHVIVQVTKGLPVTMDSVVKRYGHLDPEFFDGLRHGLFNLV